MTIQEFLDAEEEPEFCYELARGVLEVTEVPDDPHGLVDANLYDAISAIAGTIPVVFCAMAEARSGCGSPD